MLLRWRCCRVSGAQLLLSSASAHLLRNRSWGYHPHSQAWNRCFSIADEYQRKTPLEHVLLRPSMYIGSTEKQQLNTWVFDGGKMEKMTVECVPAMLKLFDEILVNAADNKQRDPEMSRIDIHIDTTTPALPVITIENDGKGIPVAIHELEGMHVPELIFGHLLTGSNFNDTRDRFTGGRHGYGAKLTNIFSKLFEVTTYDKKRGLLFKQKWSENMHICNQPMITEVDLPSDFTRVSFTPDLEKFGLESLTHDHIRILHRRCYDVAACVPTITVTLNDSKIPVACFRDYVKLFCDSGEEPFVVASPNKSRWEIAVKRSNDLGFEHMSFVNCMHTPRGGTHVASVTSQLCRAFEDALLKKGHKVLTSQVKSKLFVFVRAFVENPSFDSQTKEALTSPPRSLGSTFALSQRVLKHIVDESGIVDELVEEIRLREQSELLRKASSGGRKAITVNVPKLEDAYRAGTSSSSECTLILTEGDSAKALAIAGLEVVGRELYGVMPLKGKVLNVRQTSNKVLSDNQEILNLCNALGLDFTMTYETSLKGLRYGKVMLMTDQDHDGSHIKGLVINFFHHFWPALLQQHSFLQQFITPLVKVTRDQQVFSFYSLQEFNQWMQAQNSASTLRVKYYKGLGTSTAQEAKEYFKALDRHRKDFSSNGNEHEVMELAFAKDKASDRRQWIQETFRPDTFIDPHSPTVSFEDFVHKELIHFSYADNLRSIPSVVDGLKPSQRKVLYACFKKRLSAEIKVVQLAGFCAEQTCYHHGEAALHACIINMAQDFVGSNNIPLLVPSGQFGTRFQGGKDFASPRYLFTRLSPITRMIFPEVDDSLLELQVEDGMEVEPKHFVPIIPMLLVNGTQGIGTGWSTNIPSYNPLDIIERIRCRLLGVPEPAKALTPWIRGFKGRIFKEAPRTGTQSYTTRGVIQRSRPTQLSVTELPVGSWIADYKIFLNTLIVAGIIKEYREAHTARHVRFDILATAVSVEGLEKVGLHKVFQLNTFLHTSNMHAFTPDQKIHKFTQPEEILDTFFPLRMNLYAHRKQMLQADLLFQTRVDTNRARFVNEICKGTIKLVGKAGGVPRQQLEALLFKLGFEPMEKLTTMRNAGCSVRRNVVPSRNTFEYLLDMPIHSLTQERSARLHQAATQSQVALEALERTTAQEMWLKELADLEKKLQSQLDDEIHY